MVWHRSYIRPQEVKTTFGAIPSWPVATMLGLKHPIDYGYGGGPWTSNGITTLRAVSRGSIAKYPGEPLDSAKTLTAVWFAPGDELRTETYGHFVGHASENTTVLTATTFGIFKAGVRFADAITVLSSISKGFFWIDAEKKNWIAWSDVGSLDFTQSQKNVSGAMPMDWQGYVHGIKKLGTRAIVYGENGVTIVSPTGALMGINTIHRIGLIGRDAFAGNNSVHYFIDKRGCLYQLTDQLILLDYREFLSSVTNPVLLFDESKEILHICNNTKGYVYSQRDKSFGGGPINISGYGYRDGTRYLTALSAIVTPTFEICTDIIDFGTRKKKTIHTIQCGLDITSAKIQGAIDYRHNYSGAFTQTAWVNSDQEGRILIVCSGNEFKFRLKATEYIAMNLDSLNINYIVHAH